MKQTAAPSEWKNLPNWFKTNKWAIENQKSLFVQKLVKAIFDAHIDIGVRPPHTFSFFARNNPISRIKIKYKQALNNMKKFEGSDYVEAGGILRQFNTNFRNFLPFLKRA